MTGTATPPAVKPAPPEAEAGEDPRLTVAFDEGDPSRSDLLGGKGAGLVRMTQAGLPVPPGFVIVTEACPATPDGWAMPDGLMAEVRRRVEEIEENTGRTFGSGPSPLLVSVRSGARVSMPGMMDTILNLGLNVHTAPALADATADLSFALDTYSRFGRMYGEIVLGADGELIAEEAERARAAQPSGGDADAALEAVDSAIQDAIEEETGERIPDDPFRQLAGAIEAVFASWNSRRAITYREVQGISHELGTAVVVQAMVFGNLGSPSGTGVAFTRDPATGERGLYGEFLERGQGEDVVSGTKTPERLAQAAERLPAVFDRFDEMAASLEELYGDMLDIEFTVERGRLYLLQVRSAKRTAEAAIRVAADLLDEGKLAPYETLENVSSAQVRFTERPRFDEAVVRRAVEGGSLLATGIGASPGNVSGKAVLDPERAVSLAARDGAREDIVLLRPTTSPEDLHGMVPARGFVTALGGATSHAAVVARALDKPCVVGCSSLEIDLEQRRFAFGGRWLREGDELSLDGSTGQIFAGAIPLTQAAISGDGLGRLLEIADEAAGCRILGRATTPDQVEGALARGATGVTARLGDILATEGRLEELLDRLLGQAEAERVDLGDFEQVIAELAEPVLAAADGAPVAFRAVDLIGDEAMELLDAPNLLVRNPRLALPLGVPELISAQIGGLSIAAGAAGCTIPPQLTVRHINDPNEAQAISRLAEARLGSGAAPQVKVGVTVTSPRGAQLAAQILGAVDLIWVEVRGLQAAQFGYPARLLLTREPLDDYRRRGMLSADPRGTADEVTGRLIADFVAARMSKAGREVGIRLTGEVGEEIAGAFLRAGFNTFAVDSEEVRPARLALGKAALAEPHRGASE